MTDWRTLLRGLQASPFVGERGSGCGGSISTLPSNSSPAFKSVMRPLAQQAVAAWKWLERKRTQQLAARRLHVAETVQLGEKRFVSILEVDGGQYLIGGAAGNVSLLAILKQGQATGVNSLGTDVLPAEVQL